ncbi:hypothetical protein [Streptomyces sp. NPDC007083]|uniref:hypothetical protein n=1 Tax=Streptomyces sp. NPDC007083 TaxID=3156913 RepID=UPI0033FF8D29
MIHTAVISRTSDVTTGPTAQATRQFPTKDSGSRDEHSPGMQREPDGDRPGFNLLVPEAVSYDHHLLTCCPALMARSSVTCSPGNCERADSPAKVKRTRTIALRHSIRWMSGERDEDHAAAVVFNILATETTSHVVAQRAHAR